jgi:signal transduction histidine kinase
MTEPSLFPWEVDLHKVRFIDPYGMIGLLEVGRHVKSCNGSPQITLPRREEVIKYMDRMDFFKACFGIYEFAHPISWPEERFLRSHRSDVLLEITPIKGSDDIHTIVEEVEMRAESILRVNLNYDSRAIDLFVVALSEICQNIPEHSQDMGFVSIQKYYFGRRLGKNVVKIAVMDLGIGIRESLTEKYASSFGEKWNDFQAISLALFERASRFSDPGRGHGLSEVRKLVQKWNGKISIRSGTARLVLAPTWDSAAEHQTGLSSFPGTLISIILPEMQS